MDVKKLSNDELWNNTTALAVRERNLTLEVLQHLQEIEDRRLHLDRGYGSLYDYAIKELKYSEGAAYRRIQAMRLLRQVPEVGEKISQGELNLTSVAKVQTAFRKEGEEKKKQILEEIQGKNSKEVDRHLSQWHEVTKKEHARWLNVDCVQLTVLLKRPSFEGLNDLKAIKSHTHKTFSEVLEDLIHLGQEKWNPLQRTANSQRVRSASTPDRRYIPSAVRSEVWKRDQGQCTFTHPASGQRCGARHYLQVDHILPVALGGKSDMENLRLLCAQHNQHRAKKTFGTSVTKSTDPTPLH